MGSEYREPRVSALELGDFRHATTANFNALRQDFVDLRQDFVGFRAQVDRIH